MKPFARVGIFRVPARKAKFCCFSEPGKHQVTPLTDEAPSGRRITANSYIGDWSGTRSALCWYL